MQGRVLVIAGSDPSGGAGIQADIKTVTALGGYAMTAITALTVQNTCGVSEVLAVPSDVIIKQIKVCLEDIGADAIKIGMIGKSETAKAIHDYLKHNALTIPKIIDPVLIATSGDRLSTDGVGAVIKSDLMRLPGVVLTPNVPELAALTGMSITTSDELLAAGKSLYSDDGPTMVLKGGHIEGDEIIDFLLEDSRAQSFRHKRITSTSRHGTGCTLASAIATGKAQNMSMRDALARAIDFVQGAIDSAPGYGNGHGPLNHGWMLDV